MSELSRRYANKGIRFVAISVDEPKDNPKLEPYMRSQQIALDVWRGADINTLDRLRLGNIVPATMILDKNGDIVGRILGEAHEADVSCYLDWLLNGRRNGPAPLPQIKRF